MKLFKEVLSCDLILRLSRFLELFKDLLVLLERFLVSIYYKAGRLLLKKLFFACTVILSLHFNLKVLKDSKALPSRYSEPLSALSGTVLLHDYTDLLLVCLLTMIDSYTLDVLRF